MIEGVNGYGAMVYSLIQNSKFNHSLIYLCLKYASIKKHTANTTDA